MSPKQVINDLKTLTHMAFYKKGGAHHAERLERFYASQAEHYDSFRARLLHGRTEMILAAKAQVDAASEADPTFASSLTWADLGGGTGANVEVLGDHVGDFDRIFIVDLSTSLLHEARSRCTRLGWQNVTCMERDASLPTFPENSLNLVTFSYSLTMIPNWFAAIEEAYRALKPGGIVGVTDFFISRKNPDGETERHHFLKRTAWPLWFGIDNVFLNPDHPHYLKWRFECLELLTNQSRIPFLPGARVPYYRFIGRKPV